MCPGENPDLRKRQERVKTTVLEGAFLLFCADVSTSDDWVSCVRVLRDIWSGVNDEKCKTLWPPKPRTLGGGLPWPVVAARPRSRVRPLRDWRLWRSLRAHLGPLRRQPGQQPVRPPARRPELVGPVRCQRVLARLRPWTLVDGPLRRVAPRQPPAHRVQHDVDSTAGARGGRPLRSGPDGHHLHRGRRDRLRLDLRRGSGPGIPAGSARRAHYRGRLSADFWPLGGPRSLRPTERLERRWVPGLVLRRRPVRVWVRGPRRGQLRARRQGVHRGLRGLALP